MIGLNKQEPELVAIAEQRIDTAVAQPDLLQGLIQ